MNQILSMNIEKSKKKSKVSIKKIVIVFCIILIIFGTGITVNGSYSYYKNLKEKTERQLFINNSEKPNITTERENANTINIVVSHDKEIAYISYSINEQDEIEINANNRINIKEQVTLKAGTNNIKITAKDIIGITSIYETTVEVEDGPMISLTPLEGKIQAVTQGSNADIDKISYYWDNNVETATVLTINDIKNETLIDVSLEGEHVLHVEAIDKEGKRSFKSQKIEGVSKPTIEITTDKTYFYIKATDSQELAKIEIKLNNNEVITEEINSIEYNKKITLENGENKLTVKVYNKKDVSQVSRVKYTKE